MPMLLVLTLREASLVPATKAMREMESLAQVYGSSHRTVSHFELFFVSVNDCTLDCDVNAICQQISGSFICSCNEGFTGNGLTCISM